MVLFSLLILLVFWGTAYTFGIFFKPLSSDLGWTRATTAGAFSMQTLLHGILYLVTGRLTDSFGPKIVVVVCGLLLGLGYLLMSQITAAWQLYLFYGVIIGIGMSGSYVPLASTVARWFVKRRGLMTGILSSGIGLGTLILTPVARWLISSYSWRTSYIIVGGTASVLIVLAAQFLKRDPSQVGDVPYGASEVKAEHPNPGVKSFTFWEATHTRQFWLLGTIFLCWGYCAQAILVHIAPHATDLEISAAASANILAIIGGLSIIGRIIMGNSADRFGNKPILIAGFVLMSGALFWLLAAKETWALYLFALIFGITYGGLITLQAPIAAELFGTSSHGVIMGSAMFMATIGGAVGPLVMGSLFDLNGNYQLAFLICAVVVSISIILSSFLSPTKAR